MATRITNLPARLEQRSRLTSNERYMEVRSAKLTSGSMKYVMNCALSHLRRVNKSGYTERESRSDDV